MGWTTPTQRATGFLVTATVYNTDLIDNLAFLKGQTGVVDFEAGLISDTHNTDDLGSAAVEWQDIYGVRLHAGRQRVGGNFRESRFTMEDASVANHQIGSTATGAGGSAGAGGAGQLQMQSDRSQVNSIRLDPDTEQNSTIDTAWTVSKMPYFRHEFGMATDSSNIKVFIGFRQTVGAGLPTTENHAGIQWTGTEWQETHSGGTQGTTALATAPSAAARNVVEVYVNSSTDLEIWINGVRETVITTNLPTGTLEWSLLVISDGGGAGNEIYTVGQALLQEDL